MKVCLECSSNFDNSGSWRCPDCGATPELDNGVPLFAPQLANENDGFPSLSFDRLFELEGNNFWFRARNKLILWAIQRYFPDCANFLEIGCGTGYVMSGIGAQFPKMQLSGSELYRHGLSFAGQRMPQVSLFQMDARAIPFADDFSLIGAFDVIEHIEEDEAVLTQMRKAVRNQAGGIMITVPQHKFLWSQVDTFSCHVRRYSADELKSKVEAAGFEVVLITSFVSLLLPLMLIARLSRKQESQNFNPEAEFQMSTWMNRLLEMVMDIERSLIQVGIRLPIGGSLLLVAKTKQTAAQPRELHTAKSV